MSTHGSDDAEQRWQMNKKTQKLDCMHQGTTDKEKTCSPQYSASRAMRLSQSLTKDTAHYASSHMEQYDVHIQQLVVTKFLGHSKKKGMILPFLRDLETVKLQDSVMSNVRDGLKDHLVGVHQSKIFMAKDILCSLATNSVVDSGSGLAGILEVDRRNILRARGQQFGLDNGNDAF
jgi:hypothetical protein